MTAFEAGIVIGLLIGLTIFIAHELDKGARL